MPDAHNALHVDGPQTNSPYADGPQPRLDRQSPPRRFRLRFNLLSLLLLMAAVASWISYWRTIEQTDVMAARIPGLRDIARVLMVDDPNQYAAVQMHELWNDDFRWQVYLPGDHRYQIHIATSNIDNRELAEPSSSAAIEPGRHQLEVQYGKQDDQWQISVLLDDQVILSDRQPDAWISNHGSTGGSALSASRQSLTSEPLVLFRRRFSQSLPDGSYQTPQEPCAGILVWIDTTAEP